MIGRHHTADSPAAVGRRLGEEWNAALEEFLRGRVAPAIRHALEHGGDEAADAVINAFGTEVLKQGPMFVRIVVEHVEDGSAIAERVEFARRVVGGDGAP